MLMSLSTSRFGRDYKILLLCIAVGRSQSSLMSCLSTSSFILLSPHSKFQSQIDYLWHRSYRGRMSSSEKWNDKSAGEELEEK